MMVSTRKVGEKVAVYLKSTGELICYVEVRQIRREQVRVGVQAPQEIGIDRWEVFCEREGMEVPDEQR